MEQEQGMRKVRIPVRARVEVLGNPLGSAPTEEVLYSQDSEVITAVKAAASKPPSLCILGVLRIYGLE